MFYILKFILNKGEGNFPSKEDVSAAFPDANYREIIKSHLKFSFNNDNKMLPVVEWKLVDDGLKSMHRVLAGLENGPKPIIWLKLEDEVDTEDKDAWGDALNSDYVLSIPGINEDQPFYYQDHNGYSKIENAEWLADDLWEAMQEIVIGMKNGQSLEHSSGLFFKRDQKVIDGEFSISLSFNFNEVDIVYSWLFEKESAIVDFDYFNNEYSDTTNCNSAEENPMVYKLHLLLCKED